MTRPPKSLGFKLISMSIAVAVLTAVGVGTLLTKLSEDEAKVRLVREAETMARTVMELCDGCPIDSPRMRNALLAAKLETAGSVWILNADGTILNTPDPRGTSDSARRFGDGRILLTSVRLPMVSIGEKDVGASIPLKQVLGRYQEGTGLLDVDGETRVAAFKSLPDKGWLVGVDEPFEKVRSASQNLKRFILLTCVVLALCVSACTALFTSFMIRPYYRQRVELCDEIEAANNNLRRLHELSVGMQEHLDLNQRIHEVLAAARDVVGVDRLFLFMPDEKGKILQCRSAVGNQDEPPELIKVPVGEAGGAVGRAYSYGQPFKITQGFVPEHLRLEPPYSEIKALRSREFVALPLVVEEETVGVATADNQLSKTPITAQEIDLLAMFVNHAAVAIKNANMYEKLKDHAANMEVTDYLTRTYTYGHFRNLAKRAWAKVEAAKAPLSMGALSLRSLAEFNRINGHNRGDKVITRVVAMIKGQCSDDVVLGRCFGSTFGVLFVGGDETHARSVMSRIVDEVSAQTYEGEERLQQKKMVFAWEASQYRGDGDQGLDDFILGVLLKTRPDMA